MEQVLNVWSQKLEEIKSESTVLFNSLKEIEIPKSEDNTIYFVFGSRSVEAEFNQIKPSFVRKLKESVNNFHLEIVSQIKEIKREKLAITKEEIYAQMVKRNPAIEKLREGLGLDLY